MSKLSKSQIKELIEKSYKARINILEMMKNGEAHIGGAFSAIDIITVLYNKILKHNPRKPKWGDRDRFILSAGHKCMALYSVLSEQGYFDKELLKTYANFNTRVQMHPDEKSLPGIESPTGSLGHGLPVANGIALCAKMTRLRYKVFVMLGDGECEEGSIWESAMAASHHELDNIIVIIDRNGLQVNGATSKIMDTSMLENKFHSFGWKVETIDGHNFEQIYNALSSTPFELRKPSCIVADTIKCKGLTFAENKFEFHQCYLSIKEVENSIHIVREAKEKELEKIGQ